MMKQNKKNFNNKSKKIKSDKSVFYKIDDCPFCDGRSVLAKNGKTIIKGEQKKNTYVFCTQCDSRGRRVTIEDESNPEQYYEEAVRYWNTRATSKDTKDASEK